MRKYGKFERMPDGTRAKPPKVKNVLLQTYFTSLLCMVLCVSMFFGTSYAWFTSEVNNQANEIYIGTLKVDLDKKVGENDWVSLSDKDETTGVNTHNLFDRNICWEPGYTSLETIRVTNKGDLAFKYNLNFVVNENTVINNVLNTEATAVDVAAVKTLAGNFDVWVFNHRNNGNATPKAYGEITAEDSGWTYVGTLAEVLGGKAVLENKIMETVRTTDATAATNPGTTDGVATEDTYTIALHMKEEANGENLMGKKIVLNVKLVAYQMGKEQDAFGNKYDQMAATADELAEALQNGGMIALAADIDLDDVQLAVPEDVTAILDLNGHSITGKGAAGDSLVVNNGTLNIVGDGKIAITFEGEADNSKAVNAISNRGTLTVNGGEISNTCSTGTDEQLKQIGYAIDNYNGATLTVNGGKITASGSNYYDGIRLFCGSEEIVVTINGGEISSIWAQNPSDNKATDVEGTVIINGGDIAAVYYENYTNVLVKSGVEITPTAYWSDKVKDTDYKVTQSTEGEYTTYTMAPISITTENP